MKNIVIVGGSRGIGRELAINLSKNHTVLLLSRNLEKLKDLQKICGSNLHIHSLDLTDLEVKKNMHTIISTHFETVDILINNAGYLVNKPFLEITRADIETSYQTNVFGLIEATQATVPFMKANSHIVNIGSMGGFQGSSKFPGLSVYSSSKAAIANLTECLAEELKEQNIQVNCLALGSAQTEMLEVAFPGYTAAVSAEKMAAYIADFSLNANGWINGKVIPVSISTP